MSENNTINLDDSSVLSSTMNSSASVLEITSDSVIDIVDNDSSDTEGEDEITVNSTSENVDSSSDRLIRENSKDLSTAELMSEDEVGDQSQSQTRDHYVTSNQSLASLADQSSIHSASLLLSDTSTTTNQVGHYQYIPRFPRITDASSLGQEMPLVGGISSQTVMFGL